MVAPTTMPSAIQMESPVKAGISVPAMISRTTGILLFFLVGHKFGLSSEQLCNSISDYVVFALVQTKRVKDDSSVTFSHSCPNGGLS